MFVFHRNVRKEDKQQIHGKRKMNHLNWKRSTLTHSKNENNYKSSQLFYTKINSIYKMCISEQRS